MPDRKTIKCPFCAEEILAEAKKCKHCGEWLKSSSLVPDDASAVARAVAKGIKKKEFDESNAGCLGVVALFTAIVVGFFTHWIVGLIIFIGCMVGVTIMYYRE